MIEFEMRIFVIGLRGIIRDEKKNLRKFINNMIDIIDKIFF